MAGVGRATVAPSAVTTATSTVSTTASAAATSSAAASERCITCKGDHEYDDKCEPTIFAQCHVDPPHSSPTKSDIDTLVAPVGGKKVNVSSEVTGARSQLSIVATYCGWSGSCV